jgi:hypothetical protein
MTGDFILYAARDAGTDQELWCRYLRKCFVDGEPIISQDEINRALAQLPAAQAEIVREIMTPGYLYEYVRKLNMPAETPMVDAVRRERKK